MRQGGLGEALVAIDHSAKLWCVRIDRESATQVAADLSRSSNGLLILAVFKPVRVACCSQMPLAQKKKQRQCQRGPHHQAA